MVVTATRGERSLTGLPVSASVLEPDAIQNAPTLTTSEMLRALPSLNLSLGRADLQHPTANSASIRGLGGQRVLLLLDGVPLNGPFFGFIQWEKVPPETIERVELVPAPARRCSEATLWAARSASSRGGRRATSWGSKPATASWRRRA